MSDRLTPVEASRLTPEQWASIGVPTLYHGGVRRLRVGQLILPPARTGAPSLSQFGAAGVHSTERVYAATDLNQARFYALFCPPKGRGDVYEIRPLGRLEHDPDWLGEPGGSVAMPEAVVVRVVERFVSTLCGFNIEQVKEIVSSDDTDPRTIVERLADLERAHVPHALALEKASRRGRA